MEQRKRSRTTDGKVIRVSQEVYLNLVERRRTRGPKTRLKESWDSLMRRVIGLPDRDGVPAVALEGFVVPGSAKFFSELRQARGEAVLIQARKELERPPRPIPVREVL